MLIGEEYRMISQLSRTLFTDAQVASVENGEEASADGEVVLLSEGTLVVCRGMDDFRRALLEIVGPPECPYIGKCFPSSARTQRFFKIDI